MSAPVTPRAPLPDPAWNPLAGPPVRGETMHELFDWCVRRYPDATAVVDGPRRVTYAELAAASHDFAAELADRGVGPGDLVPVLMPRSAELLAVLLAVVRRGAAYAALDPRWPKERIEALVERLAPPLMAVAEDASWPVPVWRVGQADFAALAADGRQAAEVTVRGDDASAVFFTSGTTGTPKGVLTAHRGNVRLFDEWAFAPVGGRAVMPQSLAATWDAFGLDSWAVLLGGGTVLILSDTVELARRLRELVAEQGVDTVFLPTAVLHMVIDTDLDAFTGLRVVGTGGERLSPVHARRFLERHPDIPLHNMYGPVECTIAATGHIVTPEDCQDESGVPLGRPYGDTAAYVLDGDEPCAVGETGEICLSGAGLALGYLGDPELTAQKFVKVPVGPDGALLTVYRTGDLGHWSADGLLHFDGRADRQVKMRGYRVELDDVERAARLVPGVGSCRVVPLYGPQGACEDLCLFYVATGTADDTASEEPEPEHVRAVLAERLPGYLLPARVHRLPALPVLEDRKVDGHALAELAERLRDREAAAGTTPRDGTEARLAAVFGEVLGLAQVPRDTSFFLLGGNSLYAAQLCQLVEREFAVDIAMAQVFDAPSVRALAEVLDAGDANGTGG
ncbi:amino acid adenylation domain-containing protein [Streptomyces sp. yr375]|uniref:non-ribosomal peptide synthetase n=1 Tax=Streptomyces sp. yr375 TaxID=1761906 RepID=UPI0008B604D6|nr:non-ribosomal peptide synthetase [Streptomyces sp. yr375]SES46684.1 amino acid adenylation domain-containing protein [Streptomyces sp. yr375]